MSPSSFSEKLRSTLPPTGTFSPTFSTKKLPDQYFTPVAGYIPDRPVIKYLTAQRNIEIAFAPVAGTRILVPFRIVIPTPLGTGVIEATQFITQASPPRVAKTQ